MNLDFLLNPLKANQAKPAVATGDAVHTFGEIYDRYEHCLDQLTQASVPDGSVVALLAEFSPESIAMLLCLMAKNCIVVPVSKGIKRIDAYLAISQSEWLIDAQTEPSRIRSLGVVATHALLTGLKSRKEAGLVLFSSGTTDEPKAAVHNLAILLEKFKQPGKTLSTIAFLLFDHIGGFNTMMHALANGGFIATVRERTPEEVCRTIARHRIELLPTSPTFLNLILMDRTYERYDLSCLKIISYGTEPMPQSTLDALAAIFPKVQLKQTYGLSEVGILSTKSERSDSLFLKVGGSGYETKIVDGILHIKAKTAMLGYLNAKSPFDEEGWFNTQDRVEVKGDYLRFLGRTTDIINVGGEKVYPVEVESFLLQMDEVLDARVYGEPNRLMGTVVAAEIQVAPEHDNRDFVMQVRTRCADQLERFKIPVKISLTQSPLYGDRLKKRRTTRADG